MAAATDCSGSHDAIIAHCRGARGLGSSATRTVALFENGFLGFATSRFDAVQRIGGRVSLGYAHFFLSMRGQL